MSTGRVIWLCWCLSWAAFWFFAGFATLGLGFIAAALSVGAFWLPVGKPRDVLPPPDPPQQLPGGYSSVYRPDFFRDREPR